MNFTNVQPSQNVLFNWYLPNGSQIANASVFVPSGYVWESAYTYIPLAGYPIANITGQWFVITYADGTEILKQPFYVGNYSLPLTISQSGLSPQQNSTGYPINSSIYYKTSSPQVFSFVLFTNVGSAKYNVTWVFITPLGTNFANVNLTITGPSPAYVASAYLTISGHAAANDTGLWYVKIYLNNNFNNPALVQSFYISK